ncbi:MAG: thiamine pyrophosphate-dependent dehydrogenase E1 component subunit alpha [Acidobacteria bacterium]|nr:thiamine pyrophosphate-dependent dehydrogenase E1 component subunit alpha [Acidobacteriota bacterium]
MKAVNTAERLDRRQSIRDDPREWYRRMVEIRTFEDRVNQLFLDGLVHGTTHLCTGQEAVAVGIAAVVNPADSVTCTYRGHGIELALGLTVVDLLAEIMGRTLGPVGGLGGSMHLSAPELGLLPTFAIVGAGLPVAAGAALTAQVTGNGAVALAIFGDGATNIGAFHESLNLAAIWNLPVVFVCENNVYGEYSRIDRTTPIEDLAIRANSYAMRNEIVDGQNVEAVRQAVSVAVEHARRGDGPTLLEMKTYRYAGHSRSDTASYRVEGEFDEWYRRDPIVTYGDKLIERGVFDSEGRDEIHAEVKETIEAAVELVGKSPKPDPSTMFRHIYAP